MRDRLSDDHRKYRGRIVYALVIYQDILEDRWIHDILVATNYY